MQDMFNFSFLMKMQFTTINVNKTYSHMKKKHIEEYNTKKKHRGHKGIKNI